MKLRSVSPLACLVVGFTLFASWAFSQSPTPVPTKPTPTGAAEVQNLPPKIRYKPPVSSAPTVRGTGGTRGGGGGLPEIYVLAPEHEALTTNPQPALFWFQSATAKADFELTLIEPKNPKPVLNLKGSHEQNAGIHSISLARHEKTLKPNLSYKWSVALVPDSKNRSKDIIATGGIRFVEAPADLAAKVAKASPPERATIYAESGYWYDALQSISIAIAADPKNSALHGLRASLLEQGKLKEAAAADRK